jgi:hypothetical protein
VSRAYRALTRLYPRSFREEFGTDLLALFEAQRADDGVRRTWLRAGRDLLVTIPTQHLEAIVHRRSPRGISAAIAALGGTLLIGGVVLGSAVSPLLLLVGGVLAVAGVVSWQQHRDVAAPSIAESWWKVLLAGPALLALNALVHAAWPTSVDLDSDIEWLLTFSGVIVAISLITCGVMLGAVRFFNRPRASH